MELGIGGLELGGWRVGWSWGVGGVGVGGLGYGVGGAAIVASTIFLACSAHTMSALGNVSCH